jgi:hypothetical protein
LLMTVVLDETGHGLSGMLCRVGRYFTRKATLAGGSPTGLYDSKEATKPVFIRIGVLIKKVG